MGLVKTVYFPGPSGYNELPYRKAIVYKEDVPFFLKMGAVEKQPEGVFEEPIYVEPETETEAPEEVEVKEPSDGDKGHGVPGTFQWHKGQIDSMRAKKKIVEYVSEVAGKDVAKEIDENKTLTVIKLRAKKLIKEFLDNDGQS